MGINMDEIRVLFEKDRDTDYANAVVIREAEDTNANYIFKTKMFLMACVMGLLDQQIS